METKKVCPSCGRTLAPGAPMGLCPECLIRSGFPTGSKPSLVEKARFVPPTVEELSARFPQFEILSLIGQGGMGAVYKARQITLDRFVALKILPPQSSGDAGYTERFNREAKALARLNHPNIVAVYEFGHTGGQPFLAMEFVDGLNLRQVQAAGRLPCGHALRIVPQICEALDFAHGEGIVHRDIKPENILLDKKGRVKITDFGIAKMLNRSADQAGLTGAKDVIGTPHYMAPEQVERPGDVDHRADIYSLGVVFYELLTGELPLGKFQPPSRKVNVDVRLDEVVLHALEKEPERRYQSAGAVRTDVQSITSGAPPRQQAAEPAHPEPPPSAREQWLEKRRTYQLLYGVAACTLGLLVSVATRQWVLTGICIGGLAVAAYKLGDAKRAKTETGWTARADIFREYGLRYKAAWALSCVMLFSLVMMLVVVSSLLTPAALSLQHVIPSLSLLAVPAVLLISVILVRRWSTTLPGQTRPSGWHFMMTAGFVGLLLTLIYAPFGTFFFVQLLSERGGWNPGSAEAVVVPLCWAGTVLLPISTVILFKAAMQRKSPINR